MSNLGLALLLQGEQKRAGELFQQGLHLFREFGDIGGIIECLEGLALRYAEAEPARLVQLFALADRQRSSIGAQQPLYLHVAIARIWKLPNSR